MLQCNAEFARDFCAACDRVFSRSLNPQLQTFAQWRDVHRARIPIA